MCQRPNLKKEYVAHSFWNKESNQKSGHHDPIFDSCYMNFIPGQVASLFRNEINLNCLRILE